MMADILAGIEVGPGAMRDYAQLSRYHYAATSPARPVRVLAAHASRLVGVLVVSMPTLNGVVREMAWPGRYRTNDKSADARRVNRELRVISRVIVAPCWRGLGVARRLVEAYLAQPETPATEAIAAMGRLCPFFARAGMTAYPLPVRARDARLADALAHVGCSPSSIVDIDLADKVAADPLIDRELRVWANASRATRTLIHEDAASIARCAALRLAARPIGYAHTHGGTCDAPTRPTTS